MREAAPEECGNGFVSAELKAGQASLVGICLLSPRDCGSFATSYTGTGGVGVIEREKIVTPKKPFFINLLRED